MPRRQVKRRRNQGPVRVRAFAYRTKTGKVVHVKSFRRNAPGGARRRITR
jgi:hypothetical protein